MHAKRKHKLKQREEKRVKVDARKRAILDRILRTLGLDRVFERLPSAVYDLFAVMIGPAIEVKAHEDSCDDPEIKDAVREIRSLIKRPLKLAFRGRDLELAPEDILRGFGTVITGVEHFSRKCRDPRSRFSVRSKFRLLMDEAFAVVARIDREWISELSVELLYVRVYKVSERNFRIDGRLIAIKFSAGQKPEGGSFERIELRLHHARPHVLQSGGSKWTAYPCRWSSGPEGIVQTKWNCPALGIEGPRTDLPVFIDEHALARLEERLPLRGHESLLHNMTVDSLEKPVLFPAYQGRHLVEVCLGQNRVGYFVAAVFPGFVLVVTFLFLTMQGTPESERLRRSLGLLRSDIEEYKLDHFFTLIGSDIADDPLLGRVLTECGCGHLISFIRTERRKFNWNRVFGDHMKKSFGIREAEGGFKVGQKWIRWNEDLPLVEGSAN